MLAIKLNICYLFLFLFIFFSIRLENNEENCSENSEKNDIEKDINQQKIDQEEINVMHIFIHGSTAGMTTYGKRPGPSCEGAWNNVKEKFFSWKMFFKNSYNNIYKSDVLFRIYKKRISLFCEDKLPLIMGLYPGVHEIFHKQSLCDDAKKYCKHCITDRAWEYILQPFMKHHLKDNNINNIYTMGNWCGDLNDIDRAIAGERFIQDVEKIKTIYPHIRIKLYAFSHAGNVVLEALSKNKQIEIDTLVLLAAPIGKKTNAWITGALIKNIYNLYSIDDIVQQADFTFNLPYCARMINLKNCIQLAKQHKKIINVCLNSYKRIDHEDFYLAVEKNNNTPIISYLPLLIEHIEQVRKGRFDMKLFIGFDKNGLVFFKEPNRC
jgi:hypothetical protein